MTMAESSVEARAAAIRSALQSPTTCTTSIVASLEWLLNPPREPRSTANVSNVKTQPSKTITTAVKPARANMTKQTKARATLKTAVVEVLEEKEAELPTDQKQRLATEVFNLSLKALSEEIKASNMPALLPSSKDAKLRRTSTSSRRSLSRTASTSSHPLQVLSPNRIPPSPAGSAFKRSPSISLNLKRSPSSTIVVLQRRTSVAECACVALSALRALKAQKGKSGANPDLQLEHGLCALVGKLLQLGLTELAIKQLRALRMRLDDLLTGKEIKTSTKAETKAVPKKSGENKGQISLADLLRFDNAQPSGGLLCLMISFQSHVLRMMAADKRISVLGEAVGYLKPSNPNSPSGLILRSLSEKAQSTDKVAQQLQSLAQTMWAMGSPSSNSRTDSASTEKARLKATIMFRLQVVSFELRVLWWSIAGHRPDVELELWTPFSRCLSAFTRQAVPPSKDDYSVASDCLSSLQALDSSTKGDSKPYQTVLKSLAQLARQTGHQSEAVAFLTQSAFTSNSENALGVVWCTNHCQIASLLLEKKSRGSALEGLTNIQNATQGLRGDLRASSADLDGLFFEAAKLNRLTMLYISGRVKLSEGEATENPEWNELQTSLGEFAQTFSPFLLRYLGEPPQDMEGKSFSQYVKRMSRTKNNALSTIEAAVAMSRSSIVDGTPSWELAESILTDYTTIADHLETTVYEDNADTPAISRSKHSPHVNLSNVYWARYLHDKQAGCEARQLWKSLRRAVNLLRDRPMADKIDGFATVKLERLAQTYVDLHRTIEAKETFEEAIRCHLGAGVLQRLTLKANTASFQSICTDVEDQTGAFRRVLAAFIRFVSGHNQGQSSSHFFDDSALPSGERGLLLEIQLMIIAELAKGKGVQQPDSLNGLVRTLLTVYDCSTYPLRRLRVILRLLRFSSSGAATLDSSILSSLQAEIAGNSIDDVGLSNDTSLQRYATYLEGARTVCAFFHWGQTQPEVLDKAVSIWSTLLEGDKPEIELCVENTEDMAKQLEIVVDYFDMQGLWLSRLRALDLLSNLYEIKRMDDASPQTKALSRLGLQYSRLGYSGKAGSLLAKAQVCLEKSQVSLLDKLTWHFSYAEYLLDIGNTERCIETLETARNLQESQLNASSQNNDQRPPEKHSIDKLMSDASYVYSLLAFAKGDPMLALYHAKRCVILNIRTWTLIERKSRTEEGPYEKEDSSVEMDSMVDGVSKLAVAEDQLSVPQTFFRSGRGSAFWSFVPRHYYGLSNLSAISAHLGLFQDSFYYAEQAQKLVEAVNAKALMIYNKSLRGLICSRGGHVDTARALLNDSMSALGSLEPTKSTVLNHGAWADFCLRSGDHHQAQRSIVKARQVLSMISGAEFLGRRQLAPQTPALEEVMASLTLDDAAPKQRAISRKIVGPIKGIKARQPPKSAKTKLPANASSTKMEISTLNRLEGMLLRRKAESLIVSRNLPDASSTLAEAEDVQIHQADRLEHQLLVTRQMLLDVLRQLSSHAVYCVLSDSTISYPSAKGSEKGKGRRTSLLSPRTAKFDPSSTAQIKRANMASRGIRARTPIQDDFLDLLNRIREILLDVHGTAYKFCSTKALHDISFLQLRLSLILHATKPELSTRPIHTANYSDLGRSLALEREKSAIQIEKQLSDWKSLGTWPLNSVSLETAILERACIDPASFQANYVDIIPPSWNVVSVSLGDDRDELVISKLQSGQTPFFLRLPLNRSSAQDEDGEDFSFDHAKEELRDIIKLADDSCHDARNRKEKKDKKEWWAEREQLDRRLQEFLQNVQRVWFGGFRGIFSQGGIPTEPLARFSKSLQSILDKHLPSRQKHSKSKVAKTQLHSRVLELFVALGEPTDDSELEDAVMDLLYFVVDILQFQGERNAYDEIDFDMIIVETIDALRCYHQELRSVVAEGESHHTILILDRALHSLPWESLPCLDGLSVSRLPSLGCLRDQILRQQKRIGSESSQDFAIQKTNGSFILNPDGDLTNTQSTFSESFRSLTTWTSVTDRAPTESEFREALENRDLFLYFGHGSGAQYIRSRTIKRLDQCAATFLMGCSSGKMTEAGDFESYGTPWTYMHAGCPALVATLWDVTDKDIDRFAMGTFERWGLLEKSSKETNSKAKAKKDKAKVTASPRVDEVIALDEAVAKARGHCVLRYLNGAAPVIYGIPLYLR